MIQMKQTGLTLLALLLLAGGADAQKKKYRKKKTVKKQVVAVVPPPAPAVIAGNEDPRFTNSRLLCASRNGMPVWYFGIVKGFEFPKGFTAPMNYKLLAINDVQLDEYLHTVPYTPSDKHITIPLLINGLLECKDFQIIRTETMDSALQAEYPQLMSFVAREKGNSLNEARIECDGTAAKFMVTYNNRVYFINPVQFNKKLYYASYCKDDPNFVKKPFER